MGWIEQLRERWRQWTGDHEMEVAIREKLSEEGFYGRTAKIEDLRLVAVQRPGWLQVFRFEVTARVAHKVRDDEPEPDAEYRALMGLVREDARKNQVDIRLFDDSSARKALFAEWSEELICLRGAHGLIN